MELGRVVTINTGKGDGAYPERIAWLAEELAAMRPGIVACQEVFAAPGADTAAALADAFGGRVALAPARAKVRTFGSRPVESTSGLALISMEPWEETAKVPLPSDPADGERIALIGVTHMGGMPVTVANVHLTHLREADALRAEQLRTVLAHPLLARPGLRLVCGDFNTPIRGGVMAAFGEPGSGIRLTDSWLDDGGASTLVAHRDRARIDAILFAGEHTGYEVSGAGRVLDRPQTGTGLFPSDHFGVTAVFHHAAREGK